MRKDSWTDEEIRILAKHYSDMGSPRKMADSGLLPGRSVDAIRNQAHKSRLVTLRYGKPRQPNDELPWPVPSMDEHESQACRVLREWRGPTEPNPAWRIAA